MSRKGIVFKGKTPKSEGTTIAVDWELWQIINADKQRGESFAQVLRRWHRNLGALKDPLRIDKRELDSLRRRGLLRDSPNLTRLAEESDREP